MELSHVIRRSWDEKRFLIVLAVMCIGLTSATMVMADSVVVQPRAQECGNCGDTTTSSWVQTERNCSH